MKKIVFVFVSLVMTFSAFSQGDHPTELKPDDDPQIKTLFGDGSHKKPIPLGYFFEMNAGYTQFGGKNVFLPGINIGMIVNHNWSVGLAGSLIGNPGNLFIENIYHTETGSAMLGAYLVGGYGGGLLEYTAFPRSVVHFSVPVIIGAGYFAYLDDYYFDKDYYHNGSSMNFNTIDYNVCFVIEPGIKAEFNIIKKLRFGVGVSYRYSPNFELENTSTELLNQFTGRVSLRFGKF
jgi:hypothetical protein